MSTTRSSQQPGSSTPAATKRLLHELRLQTESPAHPFLPSLGPVSDAQMLQWEAVMKGVPGSAYEAGQWKLSISIPETYPMAPPDVRFITPVCHPNVHLKTGEICLDLLKSSWTPAYTIVSTLEAVHQLLAYPEVDSPLNVDVAALLRSGDRIGAEGLVRWSCREWRWVERGR